MDGVGEELWPQELGDPVVGGVIDENGTEQGLLGLVIVRRGAVMRKIALAQRGYLAGRQSCFHDAEVTILFPRGSSAYSMHMV